MPTTKPYFVLADPDSKGRVLGYGVYFTPDDQPATNVQVDDGYFPSTNVGWKVALCAANALRDELNSNPEAHS